MGLKGIHSPEASQWWSGLAFCLWCRKEGQNEGTIVNHLWTMHYHLGLICVHCLEYFTTCTDAMHWHTQLCKPMAAHNDDREDSPPDCEHDDNVMRMTSSCLKRTNLPHQLHILCSHVKLATQHWCWCQGRLWLPSPSGNSNCSWIPTVPVVQHITFNCSRAHYAQCLLNA